MNYGAIYMKNMKKITYLGTISIIGLLITVSITGALQATNLETYSTEQQSEDLVQMDTMDMKPVKLDLKTTPIKIKPLSAGTDIQLTNDELNEGHPAIDINDLDKLLILNEYEMGNWDSDLFLRISPDGGETFPDVFQMGLLDTYAMNPDICFLEDGIRAVATYETKDQLPEAHYFDFVDINDPSTWVAYTLGLDSSTYCEETAIATSGGKCMAILVNIDYNDIEETHEIFFTGDIDTGAFDGVYWTSNHYTSNYCSASGDRVYFCYQTEEDNGRSTIYELHCDLDENTVYTDWSGGRRIAFSNTGNCTYPDIDSTGEDVYVVYMDDGSGNQDIYCRKLNSIGVWEKHVVVESQDDEMYPSVTSYGDGATCTFVKNNDLYVTHTSDSGETWTTPEKVNDQTGSVVEEPNTADIATSGHVVWTDNRNGNTDVYFDNVGTPSVAVIKIASIIPGFGVKANIENLGPEVATNVQWSIDLIGDKVFIGGHKEGTITTLAVGERKEVKTGLVLGFGPVTVKVTADGKTEQESMTMFLFFVRR